MQEAQGRRSRRASCETLRSRSGRRLCSACGPPLPPGELTLYTGFLTFRRQSTSASTAGFACGFNWSMQHTDAAVGRRSVADHVPDTNLLLRQPEGIDVGVMAGGMDPSSGRSAVQSTTHVGTGNSAAHWRHSAAGAKPFTEGTHAGRARGDLACHGGWLLDSRDRGDPRASSLHHQAHQPPGRSAASS